MEETKKIVKKIWKYPELPVISLLPAAEDKRGEGWYNGGVEDIFRKVAKSSHKVLTYGGCLYYIEYFKNPEDLASNWEYERHPEKLPKKIPYIPRQSKRGIQIGLVSAGISFCFSEPLKNFQDLLQPDTFNYTSRWLYTEDDWIAVLVIEI